MGSNTDVYCLVAHVKQSSKKQSDSGSVGSQTEIYSLVVGLWVAEQNNTVR